MMMLLPSAGGRARGGESGTASKYKITMDEWFGRRIRKITVPTFSLGFPHINKVPTFSPQWMSGLERIRKITVSTFPPGFSHINKNPMLDEWFGRRIRKINESTFPPGFAHINSLHILPTNNLRIEKMWD